MLFSHRVCSLAQEAPGQQPPPYSRPGQRRPAGRYQCTECKEREVQGSECPWVVRVREVGKLDGRPRWHVKLSYGHWQVIPKHRRPTRPWGYWTCPYCEDKEAKK
jgi:hypothetical protein